MANKTKLEVEAILISKLGTASDITAQELREYEQVIIDELYSVSEFTETSLNFPTIPSVIFMASFYKVGNKVNGEVQIINNGTETIYIGEIVVLENKIQPKPLTLNAYSVKVGYQKTVGLDAANYLLAIKDGFFNFSGNIYANSVVKVDFNYISKT
jgi:hypothetical protein